MTEKYKVLILQRIDSDHIKELLSSIKYDVPLPTNFTTKIIHIIKARGKSIEELKTNIHDAYNLMVEEENEALPDLVSSEKKEIQVEL